jgi:nitronate monooxygenase
VDIAERPVLVAPMAGGPSSPELTRAAAHAGSLAFVPAGYRTAAQLEADLAAVRSVAVGVNLFVPDRTEVDRTAVLAYRDRIAPVAEHLGVPLGEPVWDDDDDWPAKIELLVEQPVPWVSFTFGLPSVLDVARLRKAGSRLLCTVTSRDEAARAARLRPDGLIVQSAAAGGHRGVFDQHAQPDASPLEALVASIVPLGLPVVAAGGRSTRARVRDALAAGAGAVLAGTALLLADEAATRPVHRAALADPAAPTTIMRCWTGRPARGISNAFSARFEPFAPVGYPAVHHVTAPLRRRAAELGDRDHLHLWSGTGHADAFAAPAADILEALTP